MVRSLIALETDGIHFAAAAAGAEGNDGPEGVVELFPFSGGDLEATSAE